MPGLKQKTIKAILRKKIDDWIETLPEELGKNVKRDAIVTGGCIASMLLGEKVNDFDVYFKTSNTTVAVAEHYVTEFLKRRKDRGGVPISIHVEQLKDVRGEDRVRIVVKSAGVEGEGGSADYNYFEGRDPSEAGEYIGEIMDDPAEIADVVDDLSSLQKGGEDEQDKYRPVFLSTNAVSLSGKIQVILRFFGNADQIHANYDFAHCTCHWEASSGELTLRKEALTSLLSRTLVYQGSRYPLCSLIRVRKFVERGWRINAGQVLKAVLQLQEIDLKKFENLEDQLTGVDVAYFAQVLDKLKEKNPEAIDSAYLIEIVDRMFGE
jgi:hypothetical protein